MHINEGTYDARVINAVLTETKGEDPQPVIEVVVELTGNGLEQPVELSKTYWLDDRPDQYNDNKPGWQVSLEKLRDIGFAGDDINELSSVIGFVGKAGIKNKSKNDVVYSNVSWIGKALGAKPMDTAKAKNFAAQMKAKIAATSPATTSRPAPRPAPQRTQPQPQRPAQSKPAAPNFTDPDTGDVPF
jgi:hypothetical protein